MFLISHFQSLQILKYIIPIFGQEKCKGKKGARKVFEVCSPVSARSELEQRKKAKTERSHPKKHDILGISPSLL